MLSAVSYTYLVVFLVELNGNVSKTLSTVSEALSVMLIGIVFVAVVRQL